MKKFNLLSVLTIFLTSYTLIAADLPDPDGKEADMSKPVQVYILMGQSNMLGFGKPTGMKEGTLDFAVKNKKLYPYLVDDAGNWTVRKDVRNVRVMMSRGNMKVFNNEWMTIGKGKIGPEIGIGHHLGNAIDAPVLILKSCIGNRSLGWDLLPPGSKRASYEGKEVPGYKETYKSKKDKTIVPFVKGGDCLQWYGGKQYDDDIANAKKVLADLSKYYPGATKFEVAGFFWWQGDKDRYSPVLAANYEKNLMTLIAALRKDFDAPNAKFVCATLGQTPKEGAKNKNEAMIIQGKFNIDGKSGKYPENKGKVATVYTHPLSKGGSSNGHYSGHAETYHNIGEAMGKAMVDLLK